MPFPRTKAVQRQSFKFLRGTTFCLHVQLHGMTTCVHSLQASKVDCMAQDSGKVFPNCMVLLTLDHGCWNTAAHEDLNYTPYQCERQSDPPERAARL